MQDQLQSGLMRHFEVQRAQHGSHIRALDTVAVEEPLEIRIAYWFKLAQQAQSIAVTMRSPGHDLQLAAGFLLTEGILKVPSDLIGLRALGALPSNEVLAELAETVDVDNWRLARNSFISSSCGICGKRSREAIETYLPQAVDVEFSVSHSLIQRLPELLLTQQQGFAQTGGLHAAALISKDGETESIFEDIGRHNALDKLIGDSFLNGRLPWRDKLVLMSSRSSFELVQKAAAAGVPVLASIGGPSSLAIETARQVGITLIGFLRADHFNVYSGEWRLHS